MKLLIALALFIPSTSFAYYATDFTEPLDLERRMSTGELLQDVIRVQTFHGVVNQLHVDKNMFALNKLLSIAQ